MFYPWDTRDSSIGESQNTEERGPKVRYNSTNEVLPLHYSLVERELEAMSFKVRHSDFLFPDLDDYSVFCPSSRQIVRRVNVLGNQGMRCLTSNNRRILSLLLKHLRNYLGTSEKPRYLHSLYYSVCSDLIDEPDIYKLVTMDKITDLVNCLCCQLNCTRGSLGIVACDLDSGYCGNLVVVRQGKHGKLVEEDGSKIDFVYRIGYENIVTIRPSEVAPRFILVIEKMTMFSCLRDSAFFEESPCVIICGGGQPSIECHLFVKRVHECLKNVPIYAIFNCSPRGIDIFKSYKYGSNNLAFMSNNLVVASISLLGIFHSDLAAYGIKDEDLRTLNDWDKARVENLLNEGWLNFEANIFESLKRTKQIQKKADVEILTMVENMDIIEKKISHSLQVRDDYLNNRKQTLPEDSTQTLEESDFQLNQSIKGSSGGLVGLQNLGNTCYMNSSLQCLAHTPPLVDYFLKDFTAEINKKSNLGMNGEVAKAFGKLLRDIWSSRLEPIQPRSIKEVLAKLHPDFQGSEQHDSRELLFILLNGLHEDLNRVQQNPRDDIEDCHGRPEEDAGDVNWRRHKARNDSIIVDVCHGQYKSTLVCSTCNYSSISFDPFTDLSLPLPSTAKRTMTVSVFYGDVFLKPYSVTVLENGVCKDLELAVASACCLKDDEGLLLAEVSEHTIGRYLAPSESLQSIVDNKHIVAYRHPKPSSDSIKLEICHRYRDNCSAKWKFFLVPLVGYVKDVESGDTNLAVDRLLSPLKRKASQSSAKVYSQEKSGSISEVCEQSTGNCSALSGDEDQSTNICGPIAKDSPIKPGTLVKQLIVDWTEKIHELYDSRYLEDLLEVHKMVPAVKKTQPERTSLISCLDAFLAEETLTSDNRWHCDHCKADRQPSKKIELWRLPEILVFQLKRFNEVTKKKLDMFVDFPVNNLDLSKYIRTDASGQSYVYELYAISNHDGGLGYGHYSAYSKLNADGKWYYFSDTDVSLVSEANIRTHNAYLLFYQRVKGELSGVGSQRNLGVRDEESTYP